MAGRPSVVLREQLEVAKRYAESHGSLALIIEVRANVDVAIGAARERLRLIHRSGVPSTGTRTVSPSTAILVEERLLLEDEFAELRRLRDHLKLLMGAVQR